jgi:plastocyanin
MNLKKPTLAILASSLLLVSFLFYDASAESVPEWVRSTALWYGEGNISETEFLYMIKFLIENQILIVDIDVVEEKVPKASTATVIMPNGNSDMGNVGFYIPLNLEVTKGTTVVWLNDDVIGHTIQSQDGEGNVIGLFNSDVLETGERFPHTFEAEGVYNYFCTIHPWRVGVITVR